jgi:hypothetical protein
MVSGQQFPYFITTIIIIISFTTLVQQLRLKENFLGKNDKIIPCITKMHGLYLHEGEMPRAFIRSPHISLPPLTPRFL